MGRAGAEVHGLQVGQSGKQFPHNGRADIILNMLLEQALFQIGQQLQALQQRLGGHILDLYIHLLGASQAHGGEVREVQAPDQRAQGRVVGDVIEELGEDDRVGNGDVSVQYTQRCSVQRLGRQKTRDEIHVPRGVAIRRNVEQQMRYDLIWATCQSKNTRHESRNSMAAYQEPQPGASREVTGPVAAASSSPSPSPHWPSDWGGRSGSPTPSLWSGSFPAAGGRCSSC